MVQLAALVDIKGKEYLAIPYVWCCKRVWSFSSSIAEHFRTGGNIFLAANLSFCFTHGVDFTRKRYCKTGISSDFGKKGALSEIGVLVLPHRVDFFVSCSDKRAKSESQKRSK